MIIWYTCLIAIISVNVFEAKTNFYQSQDIVSPCDDPVIYTADRMMNNTVRIYRGEYYWELNGMPDVKGFLSGPYRIPYHNFKPVMPNTSVVTVLGSGDRVGRVVRLEGKRYDSWHTSNGHWAESGNMNHLPHGGVDAIFHNGNNLQPMFIALETIKVYYYTTKAWIWTQFVGLQQGYIGGQFGENFPHDITAAFSYPSSEPDVEYYVYMFKKDKFCFRPNKMADSSKQCEKWYPNKQLFGCNTEEGVTDTIGPSGLPDKPETAETLEILTDGKQINTEDYATEPEEAKDPKSHSSRIEFNSFLIILIIIIKNVI